MRKVISLLIIVFAVALMARQSQNASANLGDTILASLQNGTATQGNNDSFNASMTPDGRYVVFASSATNLATFTDGNAGGTDVFWRDTQNGVTELISVSTTAGTSGNGASNNPTISDDGCRVAFTSTATNLVATGSSGSFDIYVRDRCTGPTTRRVDKDATTHNGCTGFDPMISGNGRYVAYYANEQFSGCHIDNSFAQGQGNIFVYDWNADASVRVDLKNGSNAAATNSNQPSDPSISADGCRIAFLSAEDLIVASPPNSQYMVRERCSGATPLTNTFYVSRGEGVAGTIPTDSSASNPGMISSDGNYFTWGTNSTQLGTPASATESELLQVLPDPGAGVAPKFSSGCTYSGSNCSTASATCYVGYQCGYSWDVTGTTGAIDIHCIGDNITNTQAHCENTLLPATLGLSFVNFSGSGGAQFLGTPPASAVAGSPYTLTMQVTNGVAPAATQTFTLTIATQASATPPTFITPANTTVTTQVNTLTGFYINAIGSDQLAFRCGASPTNIDPAADQSCGGMFGAGWQAGYNDNGQGASHFQGSEWAAPAAAACPSGTPCTLNFKVIAKTYNVWERDIAGSHTTQVNVTTGGTPSGQSGFNPSISADGRYITFQSSSVDLGGSNARQDVFLRDRVAPTTEIGSLGTGNVIPNTVGFPNSSIFDSNVTIANNFTSRAGISTDGRYVVFTSKASNLLPGGVADTNGHEDVFVHQRLASAPTTATFTVNKVFNPASAASVTIHLVCGGGATVAGDLPATTAAPAVFTVNGVPGGGTTCTATETPIPAGYTADQTNCVNVATTQGGTPSCTITNTLLTTATLTVSKDFIPDNAAGTATFHAVCTGGTTVPADQPATEATPAVFNLTTVPAGGTTCTVTEPTVTAGYGKNESACAAIVIAAGGSGSCTITNTANTTFTVMKDFVPNSAASVNVHVTCTGGATVAGDLPVTETTPAVFNILNTPLAGTNCTATESPAPVGYTTSQSGCINHAIMPGQTNQNCTFTNTSTTGASFTVNKDFVPNSAASVNIHVVCTAGATVAGDLPATEATPAVFSVGNIPVGGTSCTATEVPVPAGYTANMTNCASVAVAVASSPSCSITNTALPTTGTFTVNKDFVPNSAASVNIHVTCTGGALVAGDLPATEAAPAVFGVTGIPVGGTTCTATEVPVPAGYSSNVAPCANVALAQGGTANCTITNTALPPTTGMFTVMKDFIPNSPASVNIHVTCTAGAVVAGDLGATEAAPAVFSVTSIPVGGTACTATEVPAPAGYSANVAPCAGVALAQGGTANCTITNTALPPTPVFSVAKTHVGNFTQGQVGATYSVAVSNAAGSSPTSGTTTLVDDLTAAPGLTITAMSGSGWTCTVLPTCTSTAVVAGGGSFPAITVTVNVAVGATSPQVNKATVSGGGSAAPASGTDPTVINVLPPVLSITKTHTGNFTQGQVGATYTITVSNSVAGGNTSGMVTVTDNLATAPGLTITAMSGTGWTCVVATATCTTTNVLAPGGSYPPITVTVNVANNAAAGQTNQASVSGGGSVVVTLPVSDATVINPGLPGNNLPNPPGNTLPNPPGNKLP